MKKIIVLFLLALVVLSSCDVQTLVGHTHDYSATIHYPETWYGYVSRQTYDMDGKQLSTVTGHLSSATPYRWKWDNCSYGHLRIEVRIQFYNHQGLGQGTEYFTFILNPSNPHRVVYYSP